ncbi:unnamed protein product [Vitrella brassicaformis CCMP3155]|uniref:Uncharacterized protein n=1 Tax=Vitrella brassicaformis (strain CCMP3155) TaxID=1169540 RepID=A0A0G4EWY8_VITBC|nr:unnamed protein product [Vitrella brassicaformis CCMP3155]|eukprot:CEM03293.1 unnamed protein product [Vitrella brassicaformis CCMP3155]
MEGDTVSPGNDDLEGRSEPIGRSEGRCQCFLRQDMHTSVGPSCENTSGTQPRELGDQKRPQELIAEKVRALSQEIQSSDCLLDLDLRQGEAASVHVNEDAFRRPSHHAMSQSTFTLPDISEEGRPGPQRAEEMAIQAMKMEFQKAAGYPAAFEEFESHLVYEQKTVEDDGETIQLREVLVGTRFTPEPFMRSLRRVVRVVVLQVLYAFFLALPLVLAVPLVWKTCESNMAIAVDYARIVIGCLALIILFVALVEGCRPCGMLRRIRQFLVLFVVAVVAYTTLQTLARYPQLKLFLWISLAFERAVYAVMVPRFFWHVSRDMPGVVKRRRLYTIQMTFLVYTQSVHTLLWGRLFLPKAERTTTDGERTQLAVAFLFASFLLVATVNGLCRKMRDGPPLLNFAIIFPIIVGSLIVPRFLQAEMTALSYKIKSSLLFALYDLLGDLAVPYADMLHAKIIRMCTRIRDGRWPKGGDTAGLHGLSVTSGGSETTRTRATSTKGAALFINRAGSGEPLRSSSEIYQSVMRAGRMRSTTSGLSSMASVVDLQSNFMDYDVKPRYLRALADQTHAYNQAESLILIFINLSLMLMEQLLSPSLPRLFERLGGLCLLVAIEMACEIVLFMVAVRLHNLPILRSEDEPGVLTFRLTTLLAAAVLITSQMMPFIALFLLRALQPSVFGEVRLGELCPHGTYAQPRWAV